MSMIEEARQELEMNPDDMAELRRQRHRQDRRQNYEKQIVDDIRKHSQNGSREQEMESTFSDIRIRKQEARRLTQLSLATLEKSILSMVSCSLTEQVELELLNLRANLAEERAIADE